MPKYVCPECGIGLWIEGRGSLKHPTNTGCKREGTVFKGERSQYEYKPKPKPKPIVPSTDD